MGRTQGSPTNDLSGGVPVSEPNPNGGRLRRKRKFIVAITSILLSFIALMLDKTTGAEWATIVGLVVGLYGGAEMGEAFARRGK